MSNLKEEMQMIAFKIISEIGDSRSKYVESVRCAKEGNFDEASELLSQGKEAHLRASESHLSLVQKEASGEDLPFSLILMHAEDQMLTNESFKFVCEELIEVYKAIK